MGKKFLHKFIFSFLPLIGLAQIPDGPYLGQKPPGSEPEVFAPGLVSLPNRRDTKIVFSPDGRECFFGTVENRAFTIFHTKQENGHWSQPVRADFLGAGDKREPFISPDGKTLFFVGYWADIWTSVKIDGQWSTPSPLPAPVNSDAEEWHPTATMDGTLYFCSSRNSPSGGYSVYRSRLEDGRYRRVEKLDTTINSPRYGAWDPFIAPDASDLIFSSDRPEGFGNVDGYISHRNQDDTWTNPQNLGPAVNTDGIEYGSYVSPDGKYFFFSRPAGWGAGKEADIYWVETRFIPKVADGAAFSIPSQGKDDRDSTAARLDRYFSTWTRRQQFNGNVLAALGERVLLKKSYNIPDQPAHMRVDLESRFIIASVSKLFIKFSVLKLADMNRLALEDPLDRFVPDFPDGLKITVQQLLTHTSGLPRELTGYEEYGSLTLDSMVAMARREKLQFEPGTDTLYSNVGYFLLHRIIEKASPDGYPGFVINTVLKPMHLMDTDEFAGSKPPSPFANGFEKKDGQMVPVQAVNMDRFETGNYYSTVGDLFRFSVDMFSGRIIPVSLALSMCNRDSLVVQAGGRPGYRAYFYKNLRTEMTFIFLSNCSDVPFDNVIHDVPDISAGKPVSVPASFDRKEILLKENILRRYAGKYALEVDISQAFTVSVEQGTLAVTDKTGAKTFMKADSETTFFDDPRSAEGMEFDFNPKTKSYDLVFLSGGIRLKTKRIGD